MKISLLLTKQTTQTKQTKKNEIIVIDETTKK